MTLNVALENHSVKKTFNGRRGSTSRLFTLRMLLFSSWFQDKHATQVLLTAGNPSHTMPAEYICFFKLHGFILCFLANNVFVIIKKL